MKNFTRILAVLLTAMTILSLAACAKAPAEPTSPVSSEPVSSEPVTEPEITLTLTPKSGDAVSVTGDGTVGVSLEAPAKYQSGDTVTATLPEGYHYLAVSLGKTAGEAILYLADGSFLYKIQPDAANYLPPLLLRSKQHITARIPTAEEIAESRNLARNPYDHKDQKSTVFPHASTSNQYNKAEFGAHNAIDGNCKNTSHGNYPYESWGTYEAVKTTDYFMIDFGREVKADTLTLYLRADFAGNHDAYFSTVIVETSDGGKQAIHPVRSADAQTFELGGVTTSFVRLTGFVTDKSKGTWSGYTEVEVNGSELAG